MAEWTLNHQPLGATMSRCAFGDEQLATTMAWRLLMQQGHYWTVMAGHDNVTEASARRAIRITVVITTLSCQ